MGRWLRPPRRLRFTRAGWLFTAAALAVGVAAIPTGNNLLFLLLGAMLGFIAVSGWLSEQTIRGLTVRRRLSHGFVAGRPARIPYAIRNDKRRVPSFSIEILERDLPVAPRDDRGGSPGAWIGALPAGQDAQVRAGPVVDRRGAYPLERITIGTSFPFGLFRKERDVIARGELIIWPATDRAVRPPRPGGVARQHAGSVALGAAGMRGEFRGLREYRPGDDPRDVHWRSSARMSVPVVREYERDQAETLWICLELKRHGVGETAEEAAVEIAASLARLAVERGRPVALVTPDVVVDPGSGAPQLERILDQLARAEYRADAPTVAPPVAASAAVLVTAGPAAGVSHFGDVYTPDEQVPARAAP